MGDIAKIERAATAPAMRSPRPPSWHPKLTEWREHHSTLRYGDDGRPWRQYQVPATIPAEINELVLPQIRAHQAALKSAPKREILAALARLAVHFPDQRSESEWRILHQDYTEALAEMPADIVVEAVRRYLLKGRFYPKLAELMAEAEPLLDERRKELRYLLRLSELETPGDRAARLEAEQREEQQREALRIEADCQQRPWMRIYYAWREKFTFQQLNTVQWLRLLEALSRIHSLDEVEVWHREVAAEMDAAWPEEFNAFPRLVALANAAAAV